MDDEDDDVPTCPLCLEELDATDRAVKACQCGYQVCLWCLHTIRERLNRRCPACRTLYEEHNFKIDDVNPEQAAKEAIERQTAKKERERREKLKEIERERARAIVLSQQKAKSNLKHARILQRKLVYVIGLSLTLAREEVIRRADMFAKFGKMVRVLVNRSHPFNADAPGGPSISAYVQYQRDADALAAVRAMNNAVFDGREIRCAIATTKYCDTYVRNVQTGDPSATFHCGNANCMYYHTTSHSDSVLTREEVLARQLGPPPPAHLFLAAPHRTTAPPHHRAPSAQPASTQPASLAASRPSANRSQINSVPSSQPHSTAPVIHPLSGPTQPPNSFSATSSAAVPVPGASSAALSSFSPEATSPSTPTAPPGVAITPSHSQWSPPSSPHDDSRPILKNNRPSSRGDRSAPHSPPVALASSLPSASGPLSSATWASTQPGHPISRSPARRPPPPLGDEETRARLPLGARRQRDAPPGFEDSSLQSLSENPSQPPGFGAPPTSHIVSDDVPTSSASAERSKTSPIMVPKAASAVPSSLSLSTPRRSTSLSPTSPPGESIAPPPGFGPGPASKAEPVDDSRHKVAAAWSQKASADKVFSANDRRPVAPVREVGAHLSPRLDQETDRSRAGLEKVLASIGGSLGVSSEFQAVPQVQSPRHVSPAVSAAVESVPPQYVDTAAQNVAHLRPDDNAVPHTLASFIPNRDAVAHAQQNRYAADVQINAAANYAGRNAYQQTGSVVDPVLGSPAHASNSYFPATSTASEEAAMSLSMAGRRHRSRFSFAQDKFRGVDASLQPLRVDEVVHDYELAGRDVRPSDGSETLAMKKVPEFMAAKKPSVASSRQARSRFDFADHGSSPPRTANEGEKGGGDLALMHEMPSGVVVSAATVASSSSLPQMAQAPHPPVLGESFHQLSTEEKLASIFTSAKWSSEALPPMPQYDPEIEEVMQQMTSPLAATAPMASVGLSGNMASTGTVPVTVIEGPGNMRPMRNNVGVGVGGVAPDVVGGGGLSGSHFGDGSIGLPPPGFREATPGIVPDTTADEKTSATTGVASMVVSGGGVSNHQGETVTSNVAVGLEEALSSGTESFEDDRRRSRAQRKRDRKARQLREVAERKFAKTEGRARSRGSAAQQATHGRSAADLLGAEDNVVDQVTKATAAVVNVHTTGKPAVVGPVGSSEKQLANPLHTSSSRKSGERQTETAEVGGKERETERKQEGSSTNCGEGVSLTNKSVNVDAHGLTIASGSGVTAFSKDGEGATVSKLSEDGGKYMSVSELEREVEAARVREAQLQDKLMEITRRLRSYDNVRT